jgi:hypothetical protein
MKRTRGEKIRGIRNGLVIFALAVLAIGATGWLGIQIRPKPFPQFSQKESIVKTAPLPGGLPDPVERFYSTLYGDEIPLVDTAVILGRGVLKPFMNIPLPARFVFVHNAGKDYRHYFEATFFGIPLLKVNEGYIDGISFFESPMASMTNDPNSNQAANLTVWAEAIWFPAIWVTDPRAHWEPVDADTALLFVPFEQGEQNFLVRFNPQTGLIDTMESMRYRDPGEGQPKILWILRNELKQPAGAGARPVGSAMWLDQGSPWASFEVEEIAVNVGVSGDIRQDGYPAVGAIYGD